MKDPAETSPSATSLAADDARRRVEAALTAPPGSPSAHVVVPTSGSTGEPRRVQVSGSALRASGTATAARLGGHGSWLLALPTTHVAGLQVVARSVLAGTAPVVLDLGPRFSGRAFAAAADRLDGARRCTSLVPTQVHRLLAEARDGDPAGLVALASFDAVLLGGAATPAPVLAELRAAGARVVTTYGMSETAGGCVYDGRPLDGVTVRVVDGRVQISGPVLADGYLDDPAATAAAFVKGSPDVSTPDLTGSVDGGAAGAAGAGVVPSRGPVRGPGAQASPGSEPGRWFRTSDLGELAPDGTLTVLGRADDVVISGGVNVAPAAVEAVLVGLPAVAEVCVVGVPDPEWGEVVVAVVTLVPGSTDVSQDTLLAQARSQVTDILGAPAAPRHVVVTDALALRGPGKVDRRAVALLAARRLGRPTSTSDR